MFIITRNSDVVAYGSRIHTRELRLYDGDQERVADLYGFPRLVMSQEACLAHTTGTGLLDIFKGTWLHGVGDDDSKPIGISGILLGDFDMLHTGRPDLLRPVLVAAGSRGPAPKLKTLVEAALDVQSRLPT